MGIKNSFKKFWGKTTLEVHSDDDGYGEMMDKIRDHDAVISNGGAVLSHVGVDYDNVPASTTVIDEDSGLGGRYYSEDVAKRASDALTKALNCRNLNRRVED